MAEHSAQQNNEEREAGFVAAFNRNTADDKLPPPELPPVWAMNPKQLEAVTFELLQRAVQNLSAIRIELVAWRAERLFSSDPAFAEIAVRHINQQKQEDHEQMMDIINQTMDLNKTE